MKIGIYPPCYGCTERDVSCHGGCDKYLAWKDEMEAAKEKERKARSEEHEHRDYVLKRKFAIDKRIHRK